MLGVGAFTGGVSRSTRLRSSYIGEEGTLPPPPREEDESEPEEVVVIAVVVVAVVVVVLEVVPVGVVAVVVAVLEVVAVGVVAAVMEEDVDDSPPRVPAAFRLVLLCRCSLSVKIFDCSICSWRRISSTCFVFPALSFSDCGRFKEEEEEVEEREETEEVKDETNSEGGAVDGTGAFIG